MTNFREAILAHLQEKKMIKNEIIRSNYDKTKTFEFPPFSKINTDRYFCWHKEFIQHVVSSKALALYPVLCSLSDFEKRTWIQWSIKNLSIMSGLGNNSVIDAINNLKSIEAYEDELFLEVKKRDDGKRHFNTYQVEFIRKGQIEFWKGRYFIFHTSLIESGLWSELTPKAKVLYIALRSTACFDFDIYREMEGFDYLEFSPNSSEFRDRKWEICRTSIKDLCALADINYDSSFSVLKELEKRGLLERYDGAILVYLKPKNWFYNVP